MMIMTIIQVTSTDHHASEGVVHTLEKVYRKMMLLIDMMMIVMMIMTTIMLMMIMRRSQ